MCKGPKWVTSLDCGEVGGPRWAEHGFVGLASDLDSTLMQMRCYWRVCNQESNLVRFKLCRDYC